MAMTRLQRDFSRSRIARKLCRIWLKEEGESTNDVLLIDAFLGSCSAMPDNEIVRILNGVIDSYDATKKDRAEATQILAGTLPNFSGR